MSKKIPHTITARMLAPGMTIVDGREHIVESVVNDGVLVMVRIKGRRIPMDFYPDSEVDVTSDENDVKNEVTRLLMLANEAAEDAKRANDLAMTYRLRANELTNRFL